MAQYEHENRAEEDRCLGNVKDMISNGDHHIGAIIVEPLSTVGH